MTSAEWYEQAETTLIPKWLADIEEAELNVNQAVKIAEELKRAVERHNQMKSCATFFKFFR